MIEHVQRTCDVDFKSGRKCFCFLLILLAQCVVQILENRNILRTGIIQVRLIDDMYSTVNDRLFNRLQSISSAHNQFAKRQDKVGFQGQRIILIAVVQIDVHRIDVVLTGRRNLNDLAMESFNQREILAFRVADDHVVVSHQQDISDFTLCGERFTGTRRTKNQTVGVLQVFPVHHDHIVGQRVQSAVQGLSIHLEQFLGRKGNKNSGGRCGQSPLNTDFVITQGQAGYHAAFLLKVQRNQLAVMLYRYALRLFHVQVKLLFTWRGIQHQKRNQEHSFIPALKIFQQFLGLTTIGSKVRRNNIHIIS